MAGDEEADVTAFDHAVQQTLARLNENLAANIYEGGALFWRWNKDSAAKEDTPRSHGPWTWDSGWGFGPDGDLDVKIIDADHRRFTTPDYESESVTMNRAQAMELLEMLERWLRP